MENGSREDHVFAIVGIGSDSIFAFANYLFVWQEEALPKLASIEDRDVAFYTIRSSSLAWSVEKTMNTGE